MERRVRIDCVIVNGILSALFDVERIIDFELDEMIDGLVLTAQYYYFCRGVLGDEKCPLEPGADSDVREVNETGCVAQNVP